MEDVSLFTKVATIVSCMMMVGGLGAVVGRKIESGFAMIALAVLWIGGTIGMMFAAKADPTVSLPLLGAWTFVSGLVIGPTLQMYAERLGWHTVALAFFGTGGVMAVCGGIGMLSGIDFSGMGTYLLLGLFGLIAVGVVRIFVVMSRTVDIVHALIGMVIFSGYFIFDFFRLTKSENTWENAVLLSMNIYLDFINFLLYLLQLLAAAQDK